MLKIGVLCSGHLGHQTLEQLLADYPVEFVLTDRGSNDILRLCHGNSIPVFAGNPRSGRGLNFIREIDVDVIVSVNYLFLIEQDIIDHPRLLIFNLHGSLLPRYRGRTPHVWAIINGEQQVGITAHRIVPECDAGDILEQIAIPVLDDDTGADVLTQFERLYYPIVQRVLQKVEFGNLVSRPQQESWATWYGKRTPLDGEINWNWSCERIRNWVRAQAHPYPGAFTWYGDRKIVIDKVSFSQHGFDSRVPDGTILRSGPLPVVKSVHGALQLDTVRQDTRWFEKGFKLGRKFSQRAA